MDFKLSHSGSEGALTYSNKSLAALQLKGKRGISSGASWEGWNVPAGGSGGSGGVFSSDGVSDGEKPAWSGAIWGEPKATWNASWR